MTYSKATVQRADEVAEKAAANLRRAGWTVTRDENGWHARRPGGASRPVQQTPTEQEQEEALQAAKSWTVGTGPGVRILRTLLWMAERSKDGRVE